MGRGPEKPAGSSHFYLTVLGAHVTEEPLLAERLSKLDPQLGKVYQQIWESLYGTTAEPERTALYQMRQAFDHLFEILAPDDQVRKSAYFVKKEGNKPDQVDRKERLQFAAFSRVAYRPQAQTLAASSVQLLEVYQALNQAHKRGELSREKARTALFAMQSFLQDWADALKL